MTVLALIFVAVFVAYSFGQTTESYRRSVANARRHRGAYWKSMKYSTYNGVFTILGILAILAGIALASIQF